MAITHAAVKISGEKGLASEWNADHNATDENIARRAVTLIVAASNSNDTVRVDYLCDGTADEVEINQALAALPAGGGTVRLLEGTYTIDARIDIFSDNVSLVGMGRSTQITTTSNISLFNTGNNDVTVENIFFNGNNQANNIVSFHSSRGTMRGCWIEKCNIGVEVTTGTIVFILNNVLRDNDGAGARLGFGLGTGKRVIFSGNYVEGNSGGGISLIDQDKSLITNNVIVDNTGTGISLAGGNRALNNIIVGNLVLGNSVAQISLGGNATIIGHNYTGA